MLEFERKGEKPANLNRITDAALAKIGEKAMDAYLSRVTDNVAKRTRKGSEGQKRLKDYEVESAPGAVAGKVTLTPGLGLQEVGGVIRARNVTYMTIPLKAALKEDGTLRKVKAREWRNTRVIRSPRGVLLIVQRRGRRDVSLYALKKEVRVRARLGLRKELSKQQRVFWKEFGREVRHLLDA